MSSRFEQAYRVDGATKLTATLWNRIFRELDTRLVSIEEKKASFEEAERQLLQIGLDRINEALLPAAERIFHVAELGFLVASSDEEATFVEGQEASLTIREGDQRELFTPTEFVALTRRSTPEDWVIARTLGYSRESGVLLVRAEVVKGSGGPHDDWDVSATPGAAQAVVDLFEQVSSLRQEVADDKAAVAIDKAAAQSARTDAQNARDAAIIAKTDAESALASFMTVYRGALPSAPPDGEQGHFYFDTTLQMALVYTATGWAPLFQVALGGIRQGFLTATAGQTEIDIGGDFTFINVWRNGVLLTAGVDYTTASPKIILSSPAAGGDEIAYTGYHSTDVADFYTKADADARFSQKTDVYNKEDADARFLLKTGGEITGNLTVGGEFTYGKAKNISGTDLNALTVPGFYDGTNLANAPNSNPEWFYIEVQRHSLNDNYVHQRATALYHSNHATWVRNMVGGMWQPWRKVWDDGNLDPWAVQPIGVPIPVFEYIPGVPKPPTDRGYRYVLLSAGRTGSGGYNEGCLVDEVVTGSAPLIHASAWVSLAGSPLVGQQIRLINTERRFIRAGQPGAVQDDAMQDHTHWQPRDNVFGTGAGGTSTSFFQGSVNGSTGGVDNGRVANETRPRNIGAAYYMRIL